MADKSFIVIEGNIGAGKTSLVNMIAEKYHAKMVLEQYADNPFLPKFYENPERYSFPLELSFLAGRYNQLKKDLSTRDLFSPFIIADYYFMKSLIFAKSTLSEDEYNLYRQLFNIIYQQLPKPDLYVYLHVNTDRLLDNIKKRGRSYETTITPEYLNSIQKNYFDFFKQQPQQTFLILDINEIDFVSNATHFDKLTELIIQKHFPPGIHRMIL
ncbi:MAG: deoxynucleoside kinase [Bacteroidales bacterium]|nr:deoxynucleoside kinase [Bacteroidales bacterium]MCF8458308.1 deoxynucleoside kinase [Bacteroidales bacterium]